MAFLDVAQAFDKVWQLGLLCKIRILLPENHVRLLKSYFHGRKFRVRFNNSYSKFHSITAGIPQGSVLGPILYNIFTYDIPKLIEGFIGTFADDTSPAEIDKDLHSANNKLQISLNNVSNWVKINGTTLNAQKSNHIIFTNRKITPKPVFLNGEQVPLVSVARSLGIYLDSRLTFKDHINIKVKELNINYKKMHWLLNKKSKLSIKNKLLLYNQILRPIWLYGCQIWGCASNSNIQKLEIFQSKVLRTIIGAPWFVRNVHIRRELEMPSVKQTIRDTALRYEDRLHIHSNSAGLELLNTSIINRRLKRTNVFDLPSRFA